MSEESLSVMYFTYDINKGLLCPKSNDVHHISRNVLGPHTVVVKRAQAYEVFSFRLKSC
jgi:hypothetical protein